MIIVVPSHMRGDTWVREYVRSAARYAAKQHQGQTRKDGKTPYLFHPVRVANILARDGGVDDHEVIAAGLLHDTIEDTGATHADIAGLFGKRVADMVQEVSNDPALPKAEQKAAQTTKRWSPGAAAIKIADKTANLRDILEAPPAHWSPQRRREYFEHARQVVDAIEHSHPGLRDAFTKIFERGMRELPGKG